MREIWAAYRKYMAGIGQIDGTDRAQVRLRYGKQMGGIGERREDDMGAIWQVYG